MRQPRRVLETSAMTPDRFTSEDQLVRAHLHLAGQAVSELARRLPSHVNRDDLSSAAMLGLAQAARSWDPGRGASFERHAATRIRGALLDELRDSDWASRSVRSRARRLQQAGEELTGRLGRTPTQAELATDCPASTAPPTTSWSTGSGGRTCPMPCLALPERLRAVVIGYFFQERPMLEIAGELGVTESRVSQLRAEALILLRDGLNAHLDPDTLPAEPRPDGRLAGAGPPTTRPSPPARLPGPARRGPAALLERAAEAGLAAPTPA